jgi:uncharacterized tellurite resistance protein B-like protein
MFNFFKKENPGSDSDNEKILSKIASLFIHAARMDQDYTLREKNIIKKALLELGANELRIDELILNAEINEEKSNQMLDFTKEIKALDEKNKIKIVETLWSIISSDQEVDIYESNLMRRLSTLLYIDDKTMGNIKEKITKKIAK